LDHTGFRFGGSQHYNLRNTQAELRLKNNWNAEPTPSSRSVRHRRDSLAALCALANSSQAERRRPTRAQRHRRLRGPALQVDPNHLPEHGSGERSQKTSRYAPCDQHYRPPHKHRDDFTPLRAERHADTNFTCPPDSPHKQELRKPPPMPSAALKSRARSTSSRLS